MFLLSSVASKLLGKRIQFQSPGPWVTFAWIVTWGLFWAYSHPTRISQYQCAEIALPPGCGIRSLEVLRGGVLISFLRGSIFPFCFNFLPQWFSRNLPMCWNCMELKKRRGLKLTGGWEGLPFKLSKHKDLSACNSRARQSVDQC